MEPTSLQLRLTETDATADEMSAFARSIYEQKYAFRNPDGTVLETWEDTAYRVTKNVMSAIETTPDEFEAIFSLIRDRKFLPGGRYLYASGRPFHMVNNCLLLKAEDSREGWADLLRKAAMALQTGAGIGVDYSQVRPSGAKINKTGGTASGPLALMQMVNEIGRGVMQGGNRRSAIWAGLNWAHDDCENFIQMKNWSSEVRSIKERDFDFPAHMEFTNISVQLDDEFFVAYRDASHPLHEKARRIYDMTTRSMLKTAEPGFSVDTGENAGESLRNACTELTSRDDSDICNLGSINLARLDSIDEMVRAVRYATLFLMAGTVYSDLPYDEVGPVRQKNRRLGLGLMGIHEWLLKRHLPYGPSEELAEWLDVYTRSGDYAQDYALQHSLTVPVKTRAIAPTGTIGIIGETTTGIEPIFCVAFKRRYLNEEHKWAYQYVVDPTARRLIENYGVSPDEIEDAYTLAYNVEKRVEMQAWVQEYVDHGISSTINLPYPITENAEVEDFKDMLIEHLPNLRGITCYPDEARGGQPISVATYEEAMTHEGVVFEEDPEVACTNGVCGA